MFILKLNSELKPQQDNNVFVYQPLISDLSHHINTRSDNWGLLEQVKKEIENKLCKACYLVKWTVLCNQKP